MDQLRVENVLNEMERVAKIIFTRGTSEQLEQLMEKIDMLHSDTMLYYTERRKEENE